MADRAKLQSLQYVSPETAIEARTRATIRIRRSVPALFFEMMQVLVPLALTYGVLSAIARNLQVPLLTQILAHARTYSSVIRAGIVLELLRRYFNELYVLDRVRILERKGILGINYSATSLRFFDIREIQVIQTLLGRIFNYGNVEVSTASSDSNEIVLTKVPSPQGIAYYLNTLIADDRRDKTSEANDGE